MQLGESGVPLYFHLPQMYIQIVLHSTNQTEQNKVKNAIHVCDFTGKKTGKTNGTKHLFAAFPLKAKIIATHEGGNAPRNFELDILCHTKL